VGIPDRAWFKASEVCEIAALQPYVLRSWEMEFPNLGVMRPEGATRVYRRVDVEQVLHIKRLVFEEGLTLAGVRRRIEGEPAAAVELSPDDLLIGDDVRARLTEVKQGLRSLLALLSGAGQVPEAQVPADSGSGEQAPGPVGEEDSGARPDESGGLTARGSEAGPPAGPASPHAPAVDVAVKPASSRRRHTRGRSPRTGDPPTG
jgi:DNA-binding transcriptional MerR regulator